MPARGLSSVDRADQGSAPSIRNLRDDAPARSSLRQKSPSGAADPPPEGFAVSGPASLLGTPSTLIGWTLWGDATHQAQRISASQGRKGPCLASE